MSHNLATSKCFWPHGCSDMGRCNAFGSCVAQWQADHTEEIARKPEGHTPVAPFRWDSYDAVCRDAENWVVSWSDMVGIVNSLRARNGELTEVLRKAVEVIKQWHNMDGRLR